MARVTVEDCVIKVPNRFELVLLAAHRARAISSGEEVTVERDKDKNPVVALREIAEETVDLDRLSHSVIQGLQKHVEVDELEEEGEPLSMPAIEWAEGEMPGVKEAEPEPDEAAAAEAPEQTDEQESDQEA